jgi:hypothetical protein
MDLHRTARLHLLQYRHQVFFYGVDGVVRVCASSWQMEPGMNPQL